MDGGMIRASARGEYVTDDPSRWLPTDCEIVRTPVKVIDDVNKLLDPVVWVRPINGEWLRSNERSVQRIVALLAAFGINWFREDDYVPDELGERK